MSFLNSNDAEFLNARITKKGRTAIAKGDFNISYFQIGDSEFDYTSPFTNLTGQTTHQKVITPLDMESGVKYPYLFDNSTPSTTYGIPIQKATTTTIRNAMGPAGFVTEYEPYDATNCTGTTITCGVDLIPYSRVNGTTSINVYDSDVFANCEFITLVFDQFMGSNPTVTGETNSLIYRIVSISGNTLNLDRSTPNLSSLSGNVQVVCNKCENEYPSSSEVTPLCLPNPLDPLQQLNPWTLNVVWTSKPTGADSGGLDENLSGYTSNAFVSAKELFGYTSTGQTFTNHTGGTLTYPTAFINSFGEQILVKPSEQRCVAIVHYSELGILRNDPERFFKYDDYISFDNGELDSVIDSRGGSPLTDTEYFEVYIPFINYHRNTGSTLGSIFYMDTTDYYVKSTKNAGHSLLFRYMIDNTGVKVGKVFPKNKIIVFDDQELVAMLDYRSNRRYTLPSPKLSTVHSDTDGANSLFDGTTGKTVWVTYMFQYTGDTQLNGLPCNYYNKITLGAETDDVCHPATPSNVTMKFSGNTFTNMVTSLASVPDGFIANKFYALVQKVTSGNLPSSSNWKMIDLTSSIPNHTVGNLINPTNLRNYTFLLKGTDYNSASFLDLETYIKNSSSDSNYLGDTTWTTQPQFGDQQPFPGSVRVVRASDIEEMNFEINLPSTQQFNVTQNPTYISGKSYITEVALLNSDKDVMVIAKTPFPIPKNPNTILSVKLDF
jgi:hypothetical protein